MIVRKVELADDGREFRRDLHAVEGDALVGPAGLEHHPVQIPQEVVVPELAAGLAVGDDLQPHVLLRLDQAADALVLGGLQLLGRDLAGGELLARLGDDGRAQQRPNVVGPIGRGLGLGTDLIGSVEGVHGGILQMWDATGFGRAAI